MTDYPIGTVATATVRGVEGVRVFRATASGRVESSFWIANHPSRVVTPQDSDVTDIRPLVVLDLDEIPTAETWDYVAMAVKGAPVEYLWTQLRIAEIITEQTAPPKPPRIAEPSWGQKVEASVESEAATFRRVFLRSSAEGNRRWVTETGGHYRWDDLVDPTLVIEGLS